MWESVVGLSVFEIKKKKDKANTERKKAELREMPAGTRKARCVIASHEPRGKIIEMA